MPYADELAEGVLNAATPGPNVPVGLVFDMVDNTNPLDASFGAISLDGNQWGAHSDYFRGDELATIQQTVSPAPIDTGSSITTRRVEADGTVVNSEVAKF